MRSVRADVRRKSHSIYKAQIRLKKSVEKKKRVAGQFAVKYKTNDLLEEMHMRKQHPRIAWERAGNPRGRLEKRVSRKDHSITTTRS